MTTCDCTEEYGPCEQHSELLVSREGASLHTADELVALFISDAVGVGVELSPWGKDVLSRAQEALAANTSMGVSWLPETEDGEALRDELATLQYQVESELASLELSVYWEDGFRILKLTGGPLTEQD